MLPLRNDGSIWFDGNIARIYTNGVISIPALLQFTIITTDWSDLHSTFDYKIFYGNCRASITICSHTIQHTHAQHKVRSHSMVFISFHELIVSYNRKWPLTRKTWNHINKCYENIFECLSGPRIFHRCVSCYFFFLFVCVVTQIMFSDPDQW